MVDAEGRRIPVATEAPGAFAAWFGKSVTRDAAGRPLPFFKGLPITDYRTEEPITALISTNGPWAGFLSSDRPVAERFERAFAMVRPSHVLEFYVRLEDPHVVEAGGRPARDFQFDRILQDNSKHPLYQILARGEKDGIWIRGTQDEGDVIIPKHPQQVKSRDNSGFFDLASPHFRS